jgi:hypothetical protein
LPRARAPVQRGTRSRPSRQRHDLLSGRGPARARVLLTAAVAGDHDDRAPMLRLHQQPLGMWDRLTPGTTCASSRTRPLATPTDRQTIDPSNCGRMALGSRAGAPLVRAVQVAGDADAPVLRGRVQR